MISHLNQALQSRLPHTGTVTSITNIHPRMRQIRITDVSLQGLFWQPGQHIRLALSRGIPLLRTYTVRRYDSQQGSLDLWMLLHGQGPGSQWATTVQEGERITFFGPGGSLVLPAQQPPYYVFIGEETAAVTFQIMLETLPAQVTVRGCLETSQPGEEVPGSSPHVLPWVYRADASAMQSPALLNAAKSLELPAAPGLAYLAGEARTVQALYRYFIGELHWPRTALRTKAYWTPGKTGLD